jgi:peptide/nickel transport system ATP-binding protein
VTEALLDVRGLDKTFPVRDGLRTRHLRALRGVSFEVQRGEVVALVGESGSGKSTTARVIARLTPASGGEIHFAGDDVLRSRRASLSYRSRVQMIFQDPFASLNPVHTIGYHLSRPLVRHGKARGKAAVTARVHQLLEAVGLTPAAEVAARYPHQLSAGQRQRVAIARALAVDPELILADEPTSMLDASIRIGILNLMRELKEARGIAFLFITHDLASARYLADRTMVMYAGHIVEGGPSADVMSAPVHPYTQLLLSALPDRHGSFLTQVAGVRAAAPQLIDPPPGCPFAARCPAVHDRCRVELPALRLISASRLVRCHLA